MKVARTMALVFAVALASCSDEPAPQADLVTYSEAGFSVGGPRGWEACVRAGAGEGAPSLEVTGPAGPDNFPPVVQVSNLGSEREFGHAVRFQLSLLTLSPGFEQVSDDPAEVDGATEARSVRFTQEYPATSTSGGQPIPVSGRVVFAAGAVGDVFTLITATHTDDAAGLQVTLDAVVDSFELTTNSGETPAGDLPSC